MKNALPTLAGKIGELEGQINKLKRPLEVKESVLERVDPKVDQLPAIAEVLDKQQRLKKLHRLQKSERLKNVEKTLTALGDFEHTVDVVADAVSEVMTEVAPEKVRRAMPTIKKIYSQLVDHPYYREPLIEVSPSTRGALKNVYDIKATNPTDGAESQVKYKFSTGDMNCTALSIFLGLAEQDAYSHRADFLIIDDPSQNLDPEREEKLVEALAETAGKRQLIIASQEPRFQQLVVQKLKSKAVRTLRFDPWDTKGVKVRQS
jgi:DNA repair exonuclease SbcCD ATPase subunit